MTIRAWCRWRALTWQRHIGTERRVGGALCARTGPQAKRPMEELDEPPGVSARAISGSWKRGTAAGRSAGR